MRLAILFLSLLLAPAAAAQVLRSEEAPASGASVSQAPVPLVLKRAAHPAPASLSVDDAVSRLREQMREIASAALTEAEKRAAYHALYEDALVLRAQGSTLPEQAPLTVDEAVDRLERLLLEVALETAPDELTRERVLEGAPEHLALEPVRPSSARRKPVYILRDPSAEGNWWGSASFDTEALALEEVIESPKEQLEPPEENAEGIDEVEESAEPVAVELLADEKTTVAMHDDQTILRDVTSESGDIVLFDRLHVWVGGSVQYDAFGYQDLYNARNAGDSESDSDVRRAEVIVRSTLNLGGEVKWQYDFDSNIWRDLYLRRVDDVRAYTVTLGNQAEPMSQESILGNKFNSALEVSSPTSVFGSWRGMGVRVNKWFDLEPGESYLLFTDESQTFVTTSIGIFGEDIEDTNDTDLALTGRITFGRDRYGGSLHTGLSFTLRDGEFDRINPRPELQQADRILLAEFDADTAGIVGIEALFSRGPLHLSSEAYVASYQGGEEDAEGYGAFVEVGYYLTGEQRGYRPEWGLWAPLQVGARNIFEVFVRASMTYGETDNDPDNHLRSITVGGSWYRHKLRTSLNLIYSETDQPVFAEDSGFGAAMRVQYLF
jgi:phosphate-selective porin OprO/OprP